MHFTEGTPNLFRKNLKLAFLLMALLLAACGGEGDEEEATATPDGLVFADEISLDTTQDWYVETTGDDDNSCASVEEACLSIVGTLRRTAHFDRVHVGAGTFMDYADYGGVLRITHNISIFGAGPGVTILDGENTRAGLSISTFGGLTEVHLEGFTIQNTGRGVASGCIGNISAADITVQNVELHNCIRSGVSHTGSGVVRLIDVYIHDAVDENPDPDFTLNGSGIETSGEMIIEGGEIADNPHNGMEISGGPVSVSGTLINSNSGAGVVVRGSSEASFTGVTITNNGSRGFGRAFFIDGGRVSVSASEIYDNARGAIFLRDGLLRMNSSTLRDETGRALHVTPAGVAELDEVTITNNGRGADFVPTVWNAGNLTIRRSSINGNFQIAIYNQRNAHLTLYDSDISNNSGGDSAIISLETAELIMARTLISNNETGDAAAFESFGILIAVNLTVSNNSGVGVRARAPFSFSYSTIAENGGDGFLFDGTGGIFSDNLIVKNGGSDCTFPSIDMILAGTNIDSDGSCTFPETYGSAALLLGPLADNGGLTRTHALDATSPAVDAASSLSCPTSDQRSFARPPVPNCDVGAYEISDTMIAIEALEAEETPEVLEFLTPTPGGPPTVIITTDTLCLTGPSAQDYEVVNTLTKGLVGQLIGAGETGQGNDDWLVLSHPNFPDTTCWVDAIYALPSIPFEQMRLIVAPLAPTATPKETREPGPAPTGPGPTCDPQQGQC